MSATPAIGFIGFGEAGFNIANGLRTAGIDRTGRVVVHGERRAREMEEVAETLTSVYSSTAASMV